MEVIVVSASGYEQMLKEAPASISVIDREQLEKRFYRDLTDAMTDVPGSWLLQVVATERYQPSRYGKSIYFDFN